MADAGLIPGVETVPAGEVELTVLEPIAQPAPAEPSLTVADVPAATTTPTAEPVAPAGEPAPASVAPPAESQPATTATQPAPAAATAVEPEPTVVAEPPPGEPTSLVTLLRVEPNGDMVLAGMGPPDAVIEVWANDQMIGTTTAEKSGDWVFVPGIPLGAGGTELVTRVQGSEAEPAQSFAIVIDQGFHDEPLVVASRPGEASSVLQGIARAAQPAAGVPAATPAPTTTTDVAVATPAPGATTEPPAAGATAVLSPTIDAIEIDGTRDFFAGAGVEGATVRLYVDGTFIADATVIGGRWLVEAEDVLKSKSHRVRVDMLAEGASTVVARAEVNFAIAVPVEEVEPEVPTTPAPSATVAATTPDTPAATPTATVAATEPAAAVQPETDVAVIEATPEVPRRSVTTPATPSVLDLPLPRETTTAPDLIAGTTAVPTPTLAVPTTPPSELSGEPEIPTMLAIQTGGEAEARGLPPARSSSGAATTSGRSLGAPMATASSTR